MRTPPDTLPMRLRSALQFFVMAYNATLFSLHYKQPKSYTPSPSTRLAKIVLYRCSFSSSSNRPVYHKYPISHLDTFLSLQSYTYTPVLLSHPLLLVMDRHAFTYTSRPSRVLFGQGTISSITTELHSLGASRAIILCTPRQTGLADLLKSHLGDLCVGTFAHAAMHTPKHITNDAIAYSKAQNADSVISIGGGSTIGLGKACAFHANLTHIAIPTTYSGSEATPILGETVNGVKTTKSDPRILPKTIIYDVDLSLSLPPDVSAYSGINAIAHAVEALYAQTSNPIMTLLAKEAIRVLASSLPKIVDDPANKEARSDALYGAWLCGTCLGSVGMCLHHKLCHALGGSFGLPHAETHTAVLPHALAYNAPKVPDVMATLAAVLPDSEVDAIHGLNLLLERVKVGRALKDLGMKEEDIDKGADIATKNEYWNPRVVQRDGVREVIRRAWAGELARADI